MKGAKADIDVLLRGNAVNYAVKAQDAGGLSFGGREQTQPPKIADDVIRLKAQGAKIYVVEDALRDQRPGPAAYQREKVQHRFGYPPRVRSCR